MSLQYLRKMQRSFILRRDGSDEFGAIWFQRRRGDTRTWNCTKDHQLLRVPGHGRGQLTSRSLRVRLPHQNWGSSSVFQMDREPVFFPTSSSTASPTTCDWFMRSLASSSAAGRADDTSDEPVFASCSCTILPFLIGSYRQLWRSCGCLLVESFYFLEMPKRITQLANNAVYRSFPGLCIKWMPSRKLLHGQTNWSSTCLVAQEEEAVLFQKGEKKNKEGYILQWQRRGVKSCSDAEFVWALLACVPSLSRSSCEACSSVCKAKIKAALSALQHRPFLGTSLLTGRR